MARYLYSEIASTIDAYKRCIEIRDGWQEADESRTANAVAWADRHSDLLDIFDAMMPHGSGFNSGTKLDRDKSHADKLVFHTSYHHLNDAGYYDGWTEHTVTVKPSFIGAFDIRVGGRNRNNIKDYILDDFRHALMQER